MATIVVDLEKKSVKSIKDENKDKGADKSQFGKFFLIFSFFFLLLLNVWLVYQFTEYQKDPIQAFASVVKSSIKVVDKIWQPQLPATDGYTGFLLMGIDTRDVTFDGKEFSGDSLNVDTIMQVVYDHNNGNVFLVSIPRDTGITVTEECADQNEGKRSIHFLYQLGQRGECPGGGIGLMEKYVSDITGYQNHYYGLISLEAFVDIVDAIGDTNEKGQKGLYMNIPKATYELYPIDTGGYESIFFPEGEQFVTSERVLKYARARQYSSDFDRARRQQEVVEAIKDKVLKTDTLLDPAKLFNLYSSFKKNALISEINLNDMKAGLTLVRNLDEEKMYNIVLDDTFGGKDQFLTRPITSSGKHARSGYYLTSPDYKTLNGDDFKLVKEYLSSIVSYTGVYGEKANIYVYGNKYSNGYGVVLDNDKYLNLKNKNLPVIFNESRFLQTLQDSGSEIELYDFTNGAKPKTIQILETELGVKAKVESEANFSPLNKEEITIIIKTGS